MSDVPFITNAELTVLARSPSGLISTTTVQVDFSSFEHKSNLMIVKNNVNSNSFNLCIYKLKRLNTFSYGLAVEKFIV